MDCPTCGKSLNTEQGMRQQHTKVHGEQFPNRTCGNCGEEFYDPRSRRTYCEAATPGLVNRTGTGEGQKNGPGVSDVGPSSSTIYPTKTACTVRSV